MTSEERRILEFEAAHPTPGPAKEKAIRAVLDLKAVTYQQRLRSIAARPDALAEFPMLVHRLERLVAHRHALRAARRM
jgi:hypothetical protein